MHWDSALFFARRAWMSAGIARVCHAAVAGSTPV